MNEQIFLRLAWTKAFVRERKSMRKQFIKIKRQDAKHFQPWKKCFEMQGGIKSVEIKARDTTHDKANVFASTCDSSGVSKTVLTSIQS